MYKSFFDKFHIGAYSLPKSVTNEHVRDLRECCIDLVLSVRNDKSLLDSLKKHNVSAVVGGVLPWWFGADGKNAGTMHITNPIETYIARAAQFTDHSAIVGIDVGDEPSALDFSHYGKVIECMKEHFPNKLLYLNIYPSYGMLADAGHGQARRELGTDTYREYLTAYAENVDLPYLSFDHYLYSSDLTSFLSDLSDASSVAKEYGRHLMVVLQVNSKDKDVCISTDQLRFQAWCALAFGVRAISWACYAPGWWHNCVLDIEGNKTEQYEKLKTVNNELCTFTDEYMRYTHVSARILRGSETDIIFGVTVSADADVLVGSFTDDDGRTALLCVPLESDKNTSISVESVDKMAILYRTASDSEYRKIENGIIYAEKQPIFMYSE